MTVNNDTPSNLLVSHGVFLDWLARSQSIFCQFDCAPTDYPHWNLSLGLKRYYLMQFSYWCQQLLVLLLGLEKPRKDYSELVAHHFVTLWLVGSVSILSFYLSGTHLFNSRWSYLLNMTYIGNAVYMSMDIPDTFLAVRYFL